MSKSSKFYDSLYSTLGTYRELCGFTKSDPVVTIKELKKVKYTKRSFPDFFGFMGKKYKSRDKHLYKHKIEGTWYIPYTWNGERVYIFDGAQPYFERFIKEHKLEKHKWNDILVLMKLLGEY